MKLAVLASYDNKVGAYARPFVCETVGVGVRAFGDAVNAPSSDFAKHPEDYSVWHLGFYDDNTGKMENLDHPLQLATAVGLLKGPTVQ